MVVSGDNVDGLNADDGQGLMGLLGWRQETHVNRSSVY